MVKYIVSFGSYRQEVLTPGMAEILADELISNNFEGCRDLGKTAKDLINVERREVMCNLEPENLTDIQKTLEKCDWWLDGTYILYSQSLKELGYLFLTKDIKGQTWYFAVHPSYEIDFRQNNSNLIPDWAIRSIPYEVYIK